MAPGVANSMAFKLVPDMGTDHATPASTHWLVDEANTAVHWITRTLLEEPTPMRVLAQDVKMTRYVARVQRFFKRPDVVVNRACCANGGKNRVEIGIGRN